MTGNGDLKKRIHEEMTSNHSNSLEKNFDVAKQYIRITKDGKVDVIIKEKLGGKDKLLLYMVGKLYAKEAGFSPSDDVGNKEFMEELGVAKGSLLPWLKELRDSNKIRQVKRGNNVHHTVPIGLVERTLSNIEKKLGKSA